MRMETVTRAKLEVLGGGAPIFLPYNPEASSFKVSRSVEWGDGETQNDAYGGGPSSAKGAPDTLTFTILLDESVYKPASAGDRIKSMLAQTGTSLLRAATMSLPIPIKLLPSNTNTILPKFRELYTLTLPASGTTPPRPPVVVFSWGTEFFFTGVFTSIDLDLGTVDPKGNFKRGKVSGTMTGRALEKLTSAAALFDEVKVSKAKPEAPAGTVYKQRTTASEGD